MSGDNKPKGIADIFFDGNSKVIESFFSLQEKIIESNKELFASDGGLELLKNIINNNKRVMEEFFSVQERANVLFANGSSNLPQIDAGHLQVSIPSLDQTAENNSKESEIDKVKKSLIDEISNVTGFPSEMIKEESSFTSELGLDSISMLKILMSVIKKFPVLDGLSDKLRTGSSIAELLSLIKEENILLDSTDSEIINTKQEPDKLSEIFTSLKTEISSLTGFPEEMIKKESSFSMDLGLDSISMLKVMMALIKNFPVLDGMADKFRTASTVQEILEMIESEEVLKSEINTKASANIKAPNTNAENNKKQQIIEPAKRYVITKNKKDYSFDLNQLYIPGTVLLAGSKSEMFEHVSSVLSEKGTTVVELIMENGKWAIGDKVIEFEKIDQLHQVIKSYYSESGFPFSIFVADDDANVLLKESDEFKDTIEQAVTSLFLFTKTLALGYTNKEIKGEGLVLVGHEKTSMQFSSCRSYINTLNIEWTNVNVRSVGFKSFFRKINNEDLLACLVDNSIGREVLLSDKHLYIRSLKQKNLKLEEVRNKVSSDSVIVVTGGSSGISAEVAITLVQKTKCKIIAVGRTPMPEAEPYPGMSDVPSIKIQVFKDVKAELLKQGKKEGDVSGKEINSRVSKIMRQKEMLSTKQRIEEAGGIFDYYIADVADEEAVKKCLDDIKSEYGSINGVIHGAGFAEDSIVINKQLDSFKKVFKVKADSGYYLYKYLKDEPMNFVAFFSSFASYAGNFGQSDYAAGNAVLNSIAIRWNDEAAYPVKAFLWAIWENSGLGAKNEILIEEMHNVNVHGIVDEDGTRLFLEEILYSKKKYEQIIVSTESAIQFILQSHDVYKEGMLSHLA